MNPHVLAPNEVHIWYLVPESIDTQALMNRFGKVLGQDETGRYDQITFTKKKAEFLISRVLCRLLLSRYTSISPEQFVFSKDIQGRPFVLSPELPFPLGFNLSHTEGLIAFVFSQAQEIGIDVELVSREVDILKVAKSFFSPQEYALLEKKSADLQRELFYRFWTLKEAYVKALGIGISKEIRNVSFEFDEKDEKKIKMISPSNDQEGHWNFRLLKPTSKHQLAVAVKSQIDSSYQFCEYPLNSFEDL